MSASQPFRWSKINMSGKRRKEENKHRMKVGRKRLLYMIKMKENMLKSY
jgi:hypothetical protein